MQDFYLIRHGETDWNLKTRRFQGHTDIELNEIGIQQAEELRSLIGALDIDLWVSSDLKRAHKTALLLSASSAEILIDPRLREVHLGSAEGMTPEQVDTAHGPDFRKRWAGFEAEADEMKYPGGETRHQVVQRFSASLKDHLIKYPDKKMAFVSHGFAIRSFVYACGIKAKDFFVPNCAVLPFRHNPHDGSIQYIGVQDPEQLLKPKVKTIL